MTPASACPMIRFRLAISVLLIALVAAGSLQSCAEPLDFDRNTRDRGTFGEEVYRVIYSDLERTEANADAKAVAFDAERVTFIDGVDSTLPEALLPELDAFLNRMLPYFDSGLMPGLTRKLAVLLDEAAANTSFLEALRRTFQRPGHMSNPDAVQPLALMMGYDALIDVNRLLVDMVLENDGRATESRLVLALVEEMVHSMRGFEASDDPDRLGAILVDVLLSGDAAFTPAGDHTPHYVVRLDHRGMPSVTRDEFGDHPFPFHDGDSDGFPDADEQGRFLDKDGQPLEGLTPFGAPGETAGLLTRDDQGRWQRSGGEMAFEYVDVHATVLGYLMREARPMVEDDILFDLITATRPLLGARVDYMDDRGYYRSYPKKTELVGLLSALLVALDQENIPAFLEGAVAILDQHPDTLASLLRAFEKAVDAFDAQPTNAADEMNLFDELIPMVIEIAETPGMLEELLAAFDSPIARRTDDAIVTLLTNKTAFITVVKDGPYDACFADCEARLSIGTIERFECIRGCPSDEIFGGAFDPSTPGSAENRSLFERTLGIIWEATDQVYNIGFVKLSIGSFDLIDVAAVIGNAMEIDNMAEAYLLSVTGDLVLGDVLTPALVDLAQPLGADGVETATDLLLWITDNMLDLRMSENPTPGELTRLFNKSPLGVEDVSMSLELNMAICRSGRLCVDADADALFAAEASGLVDTLYPLAVVFNKHGKTRLLARLISRLYHHYPSVETRGLGGDGAPLPITTNNLRSAEPALLAILEEGSLFPALGDLGQVTNALVLADGSRFAEQLTPWLLYVLTPQDGLALINGDTHVMDAAGNRIEPLSPLYALLEPLGAVVDIVEADPEANAAWTRAVDRLLDLVLELEDKPGGGARFAKESSLAIAKIAADVLRDRWISLDEKGERTETLRVTLPEDLEALLGGRMLPLGVDMFDWMDQREGARTQLRELLLYMLEADAPVVTQMTLMTYALLVELLDEANAIALLDHVAALLDPSRTFEVEGFAELNLIQHLVDVLRVSDEIDPDARLIEILRNATQLEGRGEMPITAIGRAIRQVHRVEPGSTAPMTAEDYRQLLVITAEFLRDEARGGERLVDMIDFALHGGE